MIIEVTNAEKRLIEHALIILGLDNGLSFTLVSMNLNQYQNISYWRKVIMYSLFNYLCSSTEIYQMEIIFNLFGDRIGF